MKDIFIHLFFLLLLPPFLLGIVNKTKALFAGRTGAPFFQLYYDLFKLFQKGMVISSTTGWIFRIAPPIILFCAAAAGIFVPMGNTSAVLSFEGDFLLFAYLFGLARFFTTCAALDTSSAFEGMGSSREVTFAAFTEPALFFAFLVLSKITGFLSLSGMLHAGLSSYSGSVNVASLVMIVIGFFIVFLAENSRIPVDDPNTHLELTMIHEAMILDHSGPLLALIEYASSIKFFVLGSVFVNLIIYSYSGTSWLNWLLFASGLIILSFIVGCVESLMARLRMIRVSSLLIAAVLLCGSSFFLLLR